MREITLVRGNRPTSVPRSQIKKAVKAVMARTKDDQVMTNPLPLSTVIIVNRMPPKNQKKK